MGAEAIVTVGAARLGTVAAGGSAFFGATFAGVAFLVAAFALTGTAPNTAIIRPVERAIPRARRNAANVDDSLRADRSDRAIEVGTAFLRIVIPIGMPFASIES